MRYNILYSIAFLTVASGCGSFGSKQPVASVEAPRATATTPQHTEALLQAIIALDTDYRYGGRSLANGFDCSGLVAHVYKTAWNLDLPHNARAQSAYGTPVETGPGFEK